MGINITFLFLFLATCQVGEHYVFLVFFICFMFF